MDVPRWQADQLKAKFMPSLGAPKPPADEDAD